MTTPQPHIGTIIRNSIAMNAHYWQGALPKMDELLANVENLFALLEERKMRYVLVGGIALLQYIQGRNTEDIDLIIHTTALKQLPEMTIADQSAFFARGTFRGLQVDFLLTKNPLFALIQKSYTTERRFFERTIISATVEGLILLKLYALPSLYRQGDFARVGLYENDIATLMFYHQPMMENLLQVLSPFVGTQDAQAIQDIVRDLEQRIRRFHRTNT